MNPASPVEPARLFARWRFLHGALHRGWWLVTSLYLVVDARLNALELVALGTLQGIVVVLCELPAGLFADRFGRRASLVIGQLLMSTAMVATALVSGFLPLALTQMLWGLSWTFVSGADVAWLSDALRDADRTARALARGARSGLAGALLGVPTLALIAHGSSRTAAMITAGAAVLLLALHVARHFVEQPPQRGDDPGEGPTLRAVLEALRADRVALAAVGTTLLLNGAEEPFGRLLPRHAVDVGVPGALSATLWIALLGWAALLVGALALTAAERAFQRARSEGAPEATLAITACLACATGLLVFGQARSLGAVLAGVMLVQGVGAPLFRTASAIWLDRRTRSRVRATTHSVLAQAENLGEIVLGFALGAVAQQLGIPIALALSACLALIASAWIAVARRADPGARERSGP